MKYQLKLSLTALAIMSLVSLTGCGSSNEIERHHLSGKVTFQGKPVPVGMISFEPSGNGIGGGFAPIRDGEYDTAEDGRGHLGGVSMVRISGFDGIANPSNPDAPPNPLFSSVETTVTLPDSTDEMDFSLPMDNSEAN
ncbi:hypothetical protein [Bremerella alba]|uniref:Lipoprotein n=1 Tax=Bremerella alba TaxID=980252 RepID=A0A7V8V6F6_9BACT|nr:hypothetical protein [Bremerella alba]MBA2115569.1 hypothetical protein [Bremerella alba]